MDASWGGYNASVAAYRRPCGGIVRCWRAGCHSHSLLFKPGSCRVFLPTRRENQVCLRWWQNCLQDPANSPPCGRHHLRYASHYDHTPAPKTQAITTHIPEHLVEDFLETNSEFLANARGGKTASQLAAEVRAQDKDQGIDSLAYLLSVAERDTGQSVVIARFLAGLYNGSDFPFALTELRGVDAELLEHCLAVLRLDSRPTVEVHQYFPDGQARWQRMIESWNLDHRPKRAPAPVAGERYQARYVTYSEASGYRDVTLLVSLNDDPKAAPVELHFSGDDSLRDGQGDRGSAQARVEQGHADRCKAG